MALGQGIGLTIRPSGRSSGHSYLTSRLEGGHSIPTDGRRSDTDSVGLICRVVLGQSNVTVGRGARLLAKNTSWLEGSKSVDKSGVAIWRGETGAGQSNATVGGGGARVSVNYTSWLEESKMVDRLGVAIRGGKWVLANQTSRLGGGG